MRIGLFGGSFNPIHKGHLAIANSAIKNLNLDKLIFIPCQKNPFKKDINYVSGKHRLNMINLVLEEKMEVSSFEIDRKGISYTIDTVKYFKNKYKNDELFLIIGSDNLTKLSKWKDIDIIAELVKISVFKREKNINKTNIKKYNCILINNDLYLESSSNFLKGDFDSVDDSVIKYIGSNKLYFDDILKNVLDEKRYLHSKHARDFAIKLAKSINFDIKKASFAAYVHDIAKSLANENKEEARKKIFDFYNYQYEILDYQLHQELGYVILKKFGIEEDIAHAVKIHTTLALELNTLDKIVYLADKLCQGRKYDGIQNIRKESIINIDNGLKLVIQKTKEFNLNKGVVFTKEQEDIYDKWSK
ncbi:MAG: nicotinate-nucleotide adenylyltransferase [Mycoplasma sp.]|nr:nicotinate-nucleotide adenylyltransferase [Mycoplasma sp.]